MEREPTAEEAYEAARVAFELSRAIPKRGRRRVSSANRLPGSVTRSGLGTGRIWHLTR